MASSRRSELRKLIEHLERHGYSVVLSPGGHFRVCNAAGEFVMTMPQSPSDHRSVLNVRRNMRLVGIPDLPPKNPKPKRLRKEGQHER